MKKIVHKRWNRKIKQILSSKIITNAEKKDFSGFGFAKNARVLFKRDKKVREFI